MNEKVADDAAQQPFQRDRAHPAQMAGKQREHGGDENQHPGCAQEFGQRRSDLAGAEPSLTHNAKKDGEQKGSDTERLQNQVGKQGSNYAHPVTSHTRTGQHRSAIERGIERRVRRQRKKQEERGDAQQEPDQLIEPPVIRGREQLVEILHGRISRHAQTQL